LIFFTISSTFLWYKQFSPRRRLTAQNYIHSAIQTYLLQVSAKRTRIAFYFPVLNNVNTQWHQQYCGLCSE